MNSFLAKIGWKRMQTRKIKIIVPFHSFPRRDRKFQKNGKKIQKIKIVIENSIKIVKKFKKLKKYHNGDRRAHV